MTDLLRYHRQMLLAGIGEAGQRQLLASSALLVGCGALGTTIADALVRAGVGRLVIVDRDIVELTNLQRQMLFDEADVRAGLPKAEAARRKLTGINSDVEVVAHIADCNPTNAERFADGCDVIVDGTDNYQTRFLLNDAAVKLGVPYVYGGAVATEGMAYTILPHTAGGDSPWEQAGGAGPCLRCLFDRAPPPGAGPTCDTVGILGPAAAIVGSFEAAEALKVLAGRFEAVSRQILMVDVWTNTIRRVDAAAPDPACACCGQRQFDYLDGRFGSSATTLCGRNAVQVTPQRADGSDGSSLDLPTLAERLAAHGTVTHNQFLLRVELTEGEGPIELTVFPDGRAIVHGIDDATVAKSLYARFVGL